MDGGKLLFNIVQKRVEYKSGLFNQMNNFNQNMQVHLISNIVTSNTILSLVRKSKQIR